jgi:iron uptake system component EfeO
MSSARRHTPQGTQNPCSRLLVLIASISVIVPAFAVASVANVESLDEAAERYRPYLVEGIGAALDGARTLQERVAAKDLEGAKRAWLSARAGWERSEVFTGSFVPELDEQIDAWPNATSGFHAIEARLFGANQTDVAAETNALVEHLTELAVKARGIHLNPQGLLNGIAQLSYEVGESKSDGGESRISGTSLDDIRNNVAGIESAYNIIFSSMIETKDPKLAVAVRGKIAQLKSLADVPRLTDVDTVALQQATEELVVYLQNAAQLTGLARPTLESSR